MSSLPWALLAWSVLDFPVRSSGVWGCRASPTLQKSELETIEANWAFSTPWDHVGLICGSQCDCKAALLRQERCKCRTCFHKGQEKGSGDLSLQKVDGVNSPGFAAPTYAKDKMIWNSQHRFPKGKMGLANLFIFCNGRALRTRVGQRAS